MNHQLVNLLEKIEIPPINFIEQFCQDVDIKPNDLEDISYIDPLKLSKIASRLGLLPEQIFLEEYNVDYIKAKMQNRPYVASRYFTNQRSRVRTSKNIIDYLLSQYGEQTCRILLSKLEVTNPFFEDLDQKVSLNFLIDIISILKTAKLGPKDYLCMGQYSFHSNVKTSFVSHFKNCLTPLDICEKIIYELAHRFDTNFNYTISKVTSNAIYIKEKPSDELGEVERAMIDENQEISQIKAGVISSFSGYLNRSFWPVSIVKSLHHGDPYTLYMIHLNLPVSAPHLIQ